MYRYPFPFSVKFDIEMPVGAEVLDAGIQVDAAGNKTFCLWALIDPDEAQKESRYFILEGTGHRVSTDMKKENHIASIQDDGGYVWHIFQV